MKQLYRYFHQCRSAGGKYGKLVAAFSTICGDDERWVDQYLREVTRIQVPFVMYLDRCPAHMEKTIAGNPLCLCTYQQPDPDINYDEQSKQVVLDKVAAEGFRWAMSWDADETYDRDAPAKIPLLKSVGGYCLNVRWVTLWDSPHQIRMDGDFAPGMPNHRRTRFFHLQQGFKWIFRSQLVYGPTAFDHKDKPVYLPETHFSDAVGGPDLVCLHWGYLTRELREQHKARWDHNYGRLRDDGMNPYGLWSWMLDEVTNPPVLKTHDWLPRDVPDEA